jgi:hypothetical protein
MHHGLEYGHDSDEESGRLGIAWSRLFVSLRYKRAAVGNVKLTIFAFRSGIAAITRAFYFRDMLLAGDVTCKSFRSPSLLFIV